MLVPSSGDEKLVIDEQILSALRWTERALEREAEQRELEEKRRTVIEKLGS